VSVTCSRNYSEEEVDKEAKDREENPKHEDSLGPKGRGVNFAPLIEKISQDYDKVSATKRKKRGSSKRRG